jgi:hypothetical protein
LCVFEVEQSTAAAILSVFDPSVTRVDGAGKASKFGFGVRLTAGAGGALQAAGAWAITG